jgi:DNA-binding SARP family transcriptional activator
MDFRILGPLEGLSDGAPVNLGGPRQRALLTYLLLHANEVVAPERLLDDLWWEPPQGGAAALQTQISRLRKVVGARLESVPPGYVLRVEHDELDLHRLRALLAEAGAAESALDRVRLLREAESLWRGQPLAELDLPFAAAERAALDELRVGSVEDRLAAELDVGADHALVPELAALVARHPLREGLRGQLMLALYRAGRQAEALEVARETRRVLDEELGLEPGAALRELERAILQQDPALMAPPAPRRVSPPRTQVPSRRRRSLLVAAAVVLSTAVAGLSAAVAWRQLHPAHASTKPAASPSVLAKTHDAVVRHRAHVRPTRTRVAVPHRNPSHSRRHVVRAPHPTTTAAVVVKKVLPKHVTPAKTTSTKVVATTPAQPMTPAIQPDLVTLSDDFSAPTTNNAMWGVANDGSGGTASQSDGRLDLALPATGSPGGRYNQISVAYFAQCRFGGDFDARVDYTLLEWPSASGARLQLSAWIFPDTNSDAARASASNGEQYNGDVASTWANLPTTDQQGVLRVARRGSILTSYTQANGKWVALKSGTARGQVMLGLQLFATANDWSHQQVSAAFDDFSVTGRRPTCS